MADSRTDNVNGSEQFEHLSYAPIVEAVIHIAARAEIRRSDAELKRLLGEALPEYPTIKPIRTVEVQVELSPTNVEEQASDQHHPVHALIGFRMEDNEGRQIAQFTRDYYAFSRLRPYENWDRFRTEAMRLWEIHHELLGPTDIQRLGVRFINRFEVPSTGLTPSEYLHGLPVPPDGFVQEGFVFRDALSIPDYSYGVTRIRTMQSQTGSAADRMTLLLDNDVYSTEPFQADTGQIKERLAEMHEVKNRAFFRSVTEKALVLCR